MKNIWDTLSRRQFIKSAALTFFGLLSFILSGLPDPSDGIPAGTSFEKLPDSWRCPICGVDKTMVKKMS